MIKLHKKSILIYVLLFIFVIAMIVLIGNSKTFQKVIYPIKYQEQVVKYSKQYNVDPLLILAIIKTESGFNTNARSRKNAMGLMQLMENTAKWGATKIKLKSFTLKDLYKAEVNIQIGCWYFAQLMKEFRKKDSDLSIVAYNGGSGNVNTWLKNKAYSSDGLKLDKIPFKETEDFLDKVKKYRNKYLWLYGANLVG